MKLLQQIAVIVAAVAALVPNARSQTFVRIPLHYPVASSFPVDLHSDGQWELAILTSESPQRVGVYDAHQQRWIDGPRVLSVTGMHWGVGDWDLDGLVEYIYLQDRTLYELNPGLPAESLWTADYTPRSLTIWGHDAAGQPTVALLGDSTGSFSGEGKFLRVHCLRTGSVLATLPGGDSSPRVVDNYPTGGQEAIVVHYSRATFDHTPMVGQNKYYHWVYLVGDDWTVESNIELPSWWDYSGPPQDLWGLKFFDTGFLDGQSTGVICWLTESEPPTYLYPVQPMYGVYSYSGNHMWSLTYWQQNLYTGMAIYDFDLGGEAEIVLPLGDGSGWQLRNPRNGVMIRVVSGLPPVQIETAPLLADAQRDLFYIADSALYIYPGDVTTAILDELEGGTVGDASTAGFALSARPNPFNAAVTLSWPADAAARSLTIYNILGQSVRTYELSADSRELPWDGRDVQGRGVASGVYFARLETRSAVRTVKLVLLR